MQLLLKMKPYAGYYLGEDVVGMEFPFPHSDTLFQAINSTWATLWGQESQQKFMTAYQHNETAPLIITSIFPCIGDVYFVPRPLSLVIQESHKNISTTNSYSPISWISAAVYRDWLQGKEIPYHPSQFLPPHLYIHYDDIAKIKRVGMPSSWWQCDQGRIRNRIDILTNQTQNYPAHQVYYAQGLSWYLIAHVEPDYQEPFLAIMRLLGDEGIGGRRSIGCGAFYIESVTTIPDDLSFITQPIKKSYTVFSLYYPRSHEIQEGLFHNATYQLIQRQSWRKNIQDNQTIASQQVNFLKEGSHFFTLTTSQALLDITPSGWPSPVYLYGYPFRVIARGE